MILTPELILENLEIYNKAKEEISLISEYERGEVNSYQLSQFGLGNFSEFYEAFLKPNSLGFKLIDRDMTWRKLKPILIAQTDDPKFKKFISNRTEKQFINLLTTDWETFDRLMNGRWKVKPRQGRKRWLYGSRDDRNIKAFSTCQLPIINYIINTGIDASAQASELGNGILAQKSYSHLLKFFTTYKLSIEDVPQRELQMTKKLLSTFIQTLSETNVDFRKLNIDFITNSISDKIKKNMTVPEGTMLKALVDIKDGYGKQSISKDRVYRVEGSTISSGFVRVYVTDDSNWRRYYDYRNFEDMSLHREDILKQLFGE